MGYIIGVYKGIQLASGASCFRFHHLPSHAKVACDELSLANNLQKADTAFLWVHGPCPAEARKTDPILLSAQINS